MDDEDEDPVNLKTEYKPGNCIEYADTSFGTIAEPVSATYHLEDINIDNEEPDGYHLQTIKTESGANTVTYHWNSKEDIPEGDGTYCVFLTPHDGTAEGARVSVTVVIDNVPPTEPGNLSLNSADSSSVTFDFGIPSVETNFEEYRIYYKQGSEAPTTSDPAWTKENDPNLGHIDYNEAETTTITGFSPATQYTANIWAFDEYGNQSYASESITFSTLAQPSSGGGAGIIQFLLQQSEQEMHQEEIETIPEMDDLPTGAPLTDSSSSTPSAPSHAPTPVVHWAQEYIDVLETECGVTGYDNLNTSITRGLFVEVVVKCSKVETKKRVERLFSYVTVTTPHSQYINFAKREGLVEGYQDGTFRPMSNINRVEALKIVLLSKYSEDVLQGSFKFKDAREDEWYAGFLGFAVSNGIAQGYSDNQGNLTGYFGPNNSLTRAEAAKIIVETFSVDAE